MGDRAVVGEGGEVLANRNVPNGVEPHMVHPLQCKAIASARLKNDKEARDLECGDGADRTRRGSLGECPCIGRPART